mgnify:FL=1
MNDTIETSDPSTPAAWARALIHTRQTVLPKRLLEPGPDTGQLQQLFEAAAAAPDHEQRLPWRLVVVPTGKRELLAGVFEAALLDRDPAALASQREAAREKAYRAPLLMLALARLDEADKEVPAVERFISLGCAIQNMLLTAHAMGYGSALTSGQALASPRLHRLFGLTPGEVPVCFVNVGTVGARKPMRPRPEASRFVSWL